jgi:hypothetical protein
MNLRISEKMGNFVPRFTKCTLALGLCLLPKLLNVVKHTRVQVFVIKVVTMKSVFLNAM